MENFNEPIMSYMLRIHPEKFETIEKMNIESIFPKKIFMITHSFIFIRGNDEEDKLTILPIYHFDYHNFGKQYEFGGINFPQFEEDSAKYDKICRRINDILSKVYNVSNWMELSKIEGEEELLRIIGTVWEERRDRFFPVVLDEDKNLMMNVCISDPKIKDLMNYKLKFVDSLKEEALKMKMPEKVSDFEYKFVGSIDRKVAFEVAIDRQEYTCVGCGYRPKIIDKTFFEYEKEEGMILQPHRIVHHCFLGDYDRDNVVILCQKCHELEYKYFKVHWNRFFESGKLMEWNKLIEESFEFFKEFLIWLHLRK